MAPANPRRTFRPRALQIAFACALGVSLSSRAASADCLDTGDTPTGCFCTGPSQATDCDGDSLPDETDPCPGIPEGPQGLSGAVVGGFEDLRCWRALEFRLASTPGFFQRSFTGIQPVAVRRTRAEIPVDPVNPGPKPWPIRTGIVVVGVATGPSIPGHPVDGAATAEEVRAAFRGGTILPNATLAGLQSWELGPTGGGYSTEVLGYGLAVAYARSVHDAAGVSSNSVFLDALGFITGKHILDGSKETVVVGSHGSLRVPNGWAPLQYVGGGGGTPLTDWPSATPLVAVTKVRDTTCEAKALFDHLKEVAKTVPVPDYSKLGLFPIEDPRWNQGVMLSGRPELVSYEAAKASVTSPDALVRATPFGYRPVANALRGPLANGYSAAPVPPFVKILKGDATQYAVHGNVWSYEPPPDAVLAISDPAKLCEPDGEKSCSCTPKRPYFSLGTATVKGTTADPYSWTAEQYLGAKLPEALFPTLHKYAPPGTVAYRNVTNVLRKADAGKRPYLRLDVPVPADGSFRYPARQGFLPKSLFVSGVESSAGVFFQSPVGASDAWTLLTGSHTEILRRVIGYGIDGSAPNGDTQWVDETWTTPGLTGRTVVAVKIAGVGAALSGWDDKTKTWVTPSLSLAPATVDYVEYDLPEGQVGPGVAWTPGTWPVGVLASEHLTASQWYPGATEWRTNYGNEAQFTSQKYQVPKSPRGNVPPLFGNDALTHWEPNLAPNAAQSADARLATCGVNVYKPNVASSHWPVVQDKASFAGLWGQSPLSAPPPPSQILPDAWFADDLSGGELGLHLHEQLDINWTFRKAYIEPSYRGFLSGTPVESCWGSATGLNASVALSCGDALFGDCTDAQLRSAEGCAPLDRYGNRVVSACSYPLTAGCDGWLECSAYALVDSYNCGVGTVDATARWTTSLLPLNMLSIAQRGGFVNLEETNLHKQVSDPARSEALEVELEHRIGTSGKSDGADLCSGIQCESGGFDFSNGLFDQDASGTPVILAGDEPTREFRIIAFQGIHDGISAESGITRLFPYSRFPGFASQRGAVYGATLTRRGGAKLTERKTLAADAVTLLPPGVREKTIAASSFPGLGARETSFRVQLVGDMILDCGHPPVHAEIHPFRAGVVHVTPPVADFQGFERVTRYSLFSWARQVDGPESLAFDLWPPPRPSGKTKIGHRFLLPTDATGSGFVCLPWPSASPNRLRCDIAKSDFSYNPGNADVCSDNPRMLPSCATSLAGGLIEVFWQ